jgi:hypothetical protein
MTAAGTMFKAHRHCMPTTLRAAVLHVNRVDLSANEDVTRTGTDKFGGRSDRSLQSKARRLVPESVLAAARQASYAKTEAR